MKAIVINKQDQSLSYTDVPNPVLKSGEVLCLLKTGLESSNVERLSFILLINQLVMIYAQTFFKNSKKVFDKVASLRHKPSSR